MANINPFPPGKSPSRFVQSNKPGAPNSNSRMDGCTPKPGRDYASAFLGNNLGTVSEKTSEQSRDSNKASNHGEKSKASGHSSRAIASGVSSVPSDSASSGPIGSIGLAGESSGKTPPLQVDRDFTNPISDGLGSCPTSGGYGHHHHNTYSHGSPSGYNVSASSTSDLRPASESLGGSSKSKLLGSASGSLGGSSNSKLPDSNLGPVSESLVGSSNSKSPDSNLGPASESASGVLGAIFKILG